MRYELGKLWPSPKVYDEMPVGTRWVDVAEKTRDGSSFVGWLEVTEVPVPQEPAPESFRRRFMECDSCRGKPGMPILCVGCLQNRAALCAADDELSHAKQQLAEQSGELCRAKLENEARRKCIDSMTEQIANLRRTVAAIGLGHTDDTGPDA
jgi:hypothetical protein